MHRSAVPAGQRGSTLIDVLVGAAILAAVAAAAFSATAAGAGMALRGARAAQEAAVLQRALELARVGRPIPATIQSYTVTSANRALADGADILTHRAIANGACQGSCSFPRAIASSTLRRYDVTVRPTPPTAEGATISGATFTRP